MIRIQRANKQLLIQDDKLDYYLSRGYWEVNEKQHVMTEDNSSKDSSIPSHENLPEEPQEKPDRKSKSGKEA